MSEPIPSPSPRPAGVSFPLKVLTGAILLLVALLLIGFLLPGSWEVERSVLVAAPPAAVFPALEDPRRWDDWAPLGEIPATFSGPERGAGATRRWDHAEYGDGVFTIVATVPDQEVRYHVEVQEGSLVTDGTFRLTAEGDGTRVTWTEAGDFGWNPLLGFMARGMDRVQGNQMELALAKLAQAVPARPQP